MSENAAQNVTNLFSFAKNMRNDAKAKTLQIHHQQIRNLGRCQIITKITCSWCGFVLVVFLGFAEERVGVLIILTLQSGRKWAKRRWWWQAPSTNLPCLHHRAQHCPENSALVKVLATHNGVSTSSLISTFDNRHIHSMQISPFTSKSISAAKVHTIISYLKKAYRKYFFLL